MMSYELEGINLMNFQENFLLKGERNIVDTKAEEAATSKFLFWEVISFSSLKLPH